MSIARPCPYSEEKEFCKYEIYSGQPRFDKCSTCNRMKSDTSEKITREVSMFEEVKGYDKMIEKYKEIYQRLKEENPCIFCVQYDGGCQLKSHSCNSTYLRMYYEKSYSEIEPFLRNIHIKELEEENKKLKEKVEKYREAVDKCLHITFIGAGCQVHTVPQYACLVDKYLTEVEGLAFWKN